MSKSERQSLTLKFFTLSILVLCLGLFSNTSTGAFLRSLPNRYMPQSQGKLITRERLYPSEPVRLTEVKIGDKNATFDAEIIAEDDWLKNLSFKLKNVSGANITYAVIELSFPDNKSTGILMVRDLRFGQRPGEVNSTNPPLLLKPGQSLDISLETQYPGLKRFLESRQPINTHKTLSIRPYIITFEDGTQWSLGNFSHPDPANPKKYNKIINPSDAFKPTVHSDS